MKLYYGWYVVAISVLVLALAIGGSIQAFGLFVLPVSEAYGLSRAEVNMGAILLNLGMAAAGPVVGRILDRHSSRLLMAVAAVLFGGGLVALGLSRNVWFSAVVVAVPVAVAAVGCGTVTSPTVVARWFTVHRARALAIAMVGISLGPVLVVPLVGQLIAALGWRQTLVAMGIGIGALVLLLALVMRERPGPADIEVRSVGAADGAAAAIDGTPLTIGQLLALPHFWAISLSAALAFGIMQVIIVSLVPYAQGRGLSVTRAASLMSAYGGGAILGTLLLAWLGDRFERLGLAAALTGLLAIAGASLLLAASYPAMMAGAGAIGVICGAFTPAFLALVADRFGAASFGAANGTASFMSTVVSAGCIFAGGAIFDRTGSYRLVFLSFLAIGLVAAVLMLASGPLARRHAVAQA